MCCYQPHQTKEALHANITPVVFAAVNNTESSIPVQSDASGVQEQVHGGVAVVRFADPLVTQVIPRPRTSPEDVEGLYYSHEDTERFRREYIELRKAYRQRKVAAAAAAANKQANVAQDQSGKGYEHNNEKTAGSIFRRFLSYALTSPPPASVLSMKGDQTLAPVASPDMQKDGSTKPAATLGGAAELLYTWDLGMVVSSSF